MMTSPLPFRTIGAGFSSVFGMTFHTFNKLQHRGVLMTTFVSTGFKTSLTAMAAASLLAACGGGGGGTAVTAPTLSGTAATGAPITNGTVSMKCAGGAATTTTTTAAGGWQISLSGQTLPCAIEVSGGNLAAGVKYQSLALQAGVANITPLTSLIVANAVGQDPSTWFANPAIATSLASVQAAAITTAMNTVNNQLGLTAGLLNNGNPLTSTFQANGTDPLDKVLDAIKAALASSGVSYASLLTSAAGKTFIPPTAFSSALATQVAALTGGGGAGEGGTTTNLQYATYSAAPFTGGTQTAFTVTLLKVEDSGSVAPNPKYNRVTLMGTGGSMAREIKIYVKDDDCTVFNVSHAWAADAATLQGGSAVGTYVSNPPIGSTLGLEPANNTITLADLLLDGNAPHASTLRGSIRPNTKVCASAVAP
jgi:hypothetical protein